MRTVTGSPFFTIATAHCAPLLPCSQMHLAAAPTFVRCTITGKKVGLHAYGSSTPRLEACALEKCGTQGVRAQESAAPALLG